MKKMLSLFVIIILLPSSLAIELALHRDFGTKIGEKIKGTFSARIKDADGVERVEFYFDGNLVSTATEEPYKWVFNTGDYPEGEHVIKAIVYFHGGGSWEGFKTAYFAYSFGKWWTLYIWSVILVVAAVVIISLWVTNRERRRPQGRTRCPQCSTIFDRKWSAMHKGNAYRNTCPTCAKTFWAYRISDEEAGANANSGYPQSP